MGPILAFAYGAIAYLTFFGTILYAIGFTSGLAVPKDIDDGLSGSTVEALIINLVLLTVFALQHSIMARKPFKRWWTQFVPAAVERSTYVLLASLILIGLFWLWRPMPAIVWNVSEPTLAMALTGVGCSAGSWCSSARSSSTTSSCSACSR